MPPPPNDFNKIVYEQGPEIEANGTFYPTALKGGGLFLPMVSGWAGRWRE